MSYYCGYYPYYPYYGGMYSYAFPYYGYPAGYVYTLPTLPVVYTAVPQFQRGEHRVGNCLMICQ
jgi:heme/copper-type cytochrome/quinol oxidase subunit 1